MAQARSFSLGGSSRAGLLFAAILAAVTGVLVFVLLQGNDGANVKNTNTGIETTVVTAKQDIPARTEITADMVELTKVPSNALLAGAFADRNVVTGRVAKIPIYKGEQLVQDKLATVKSDLGLSYIVPVGMRAIAVGVDKVIGAGGLIRPGDRVDILALIDVSHKDLTTGKEFEETRAMTLGQNIEVLAVEDKLQNVTTAPGDKDTVKDGTLVEQPDPVRDGKVVTIALTPQAAQNLLLADGKGKIRLSVRAPGDTQIVDMTNSTFLDLADPAFSQLLQDVLSRR